MARKKKDLNTFKIYNKMAKYTVKKMPFLDFYYTTNPANLYQNLTNKI